MKITILCSDASHPVNPYLSAWKNTKCHEHEIQIIRKREDLTCGDILFLVSCTELIPDEDRNAFNVVLVLHASDLPQGRGWSPHVWEIANGANQITVSLLEATASADSGSIWKKLKIPVPAHALWNEINELLFNVEIDLLNFAIENFSCIKPTPQDLNSAAIYYRRRVPEDGQIDPNGSIADQFNLIRVCDPSRYPAFFELHGIKFKILIEKLDD